MIRSSSILLSALVTLLPFSSIAQNAPQELKTGVDPLAPPLSMTNVDGTITGYSVDIVRALEKELGTPIKILPMQFSGTVPAMQAGNIDFIGPQITVTPARLDNMLFSEPVIDINAQFIVAAKGPDYLTAESLKGKQVAVNKGTNWDAWVRSRGASEGWVPVAYGSTNDSVAAVLSGRAVATVTASPQAIWAVRQNKNLKLAYVEKTGDVMAMAFRKDSPDLRNKVDVALECLKSTGKLAAIYKTWFGDEKPSATITEPMPGYGVVGTKGYDASAHERTCK